MVNCVGEKKRILNFVGWIHSFNKYTNWCNDIFNTKSELERRSDFSNVLLEKK